MSNHNHEGKIWSNATPSVNRHAGPGTDFGVIDSLQAGQSLIVLCYSLGDPVTFTNPFQTNTSEAWDFVVTSDQDPGGYVADVFVDTGAEITQQLGVQGSCDLLQQRLANSNSSNQPIG